SGFAVPIQVYSLIDSYVMATAEHREPYESRGSRTCLGARGGEIPPRDSTFSSDRPAPDALGMSASLRSRPNLRTAANRRGVPTRDIGRGGPREPKPSRSSRQMPNDRSSVLPGWSRMTG